MLEKIHYDGRYVTLLDVYRSGSFTATGSRLALTPSAVAQQVHSVERELETVLFIRGDRGLLPTEECRVLAEYINRIQSMCRRMGDALACSERREERLCVGITQSVMDFALAGMLDRIFAEEEEILPRLTVTTDSAKALCEKLGRYEIDLAVVEGSGYGGDFNEMMLDTDYLTVVLPVDSPYIGQGWIDFEQLKREPLIMKPKESGTGRLFSACLVGAGYDEAKLRIMMEVGSVDTILRLVAGHYGLSVLSKKACSKACAEKKVATLPLSGVNMARCIRVLYRKGEERGEILGAISRCYERAMQEIFMSGGAAESTPSEKAYERKYLKS